MHYRRRLLVRREDASVVHALRPHAEGLEAADDPPRRAFAHRLRRELRALRGDPAAGEVREELLRRYVLREVAASVRRHEHLRPEPRLALEEKARDAALRGDGGGEHSGCPSADDGELKRDFLLMLRHVAKDWVVCFLDRINKIYRISGGGLEFI